MRRFLATATGVAAGLLLCGACSSSPTPPCGGPGSYSTTLSAGQSTTLAGLSVKSLSTLKGTRQVSLTLFVTKPAATAVVGKIGVTAVDYSGQGESSTWDWTLHWIQPGVPTVARVADTPGDLDYPVDRISDFQLCVKPAPKGAGA